jgi:hypothetical protein
MLNYKNQNQNQNQLKKDIEKRPWLTYHTRDLDHKTKITS